MTKMNELTIYLLQNFASHLLAAIITLFILKWLLQYCNVPSARQVQFAGRRNSNIYDFLPRTKSKRALRDRSSHSSSRKCSKSKTGPYINEKQSYVLSHDGFLLPVMGREETIYNTSINEIEREPSEFDLSPREPPLSKVPPKSRYDLVLFHENKGKVESSNNSKTGSEDPPANNAKEPKKSSKKNQRSSSKESSNFSDHSSKGSLTFRGLSRDSLVLKRRTSKPSREGSSQSLKMSRKSSPKYRMDLKKPASQGSLVSEEPSRKSSEVSKDLSSHASIVLVSKDHSKKPSDVFRNPSQQGSSIHEQPTELSHTVSRYPSQKNSPVQSSISSKESSPQSSKDSHLNDQNSEGRSSESEKQEGSSKNIDESDENDTSMSGKKCKKKVIVIDITKIPPCPPDPPCKTSPKPERQLSDNKLNHRPYENIDCDEIIRRIPSNVCQTDYYTEAGSEDSSEPLSEKQKGDWAESPFCIRSPSYQLSKRYCEQEEREKTCEGNSFRTVVIDFKPGYFLSCFSKCCRKLFTHNSKNDLVSKDCMCTCSGCTYNSKSSRTSSKVREKSNKGPQNKLEDTQRKSNKDKEHDPRKSQNKPEDESRKLNNKSEDDPRKSKNKQEDDPQKSRNNSENDPRKSQEQQEDKPQKTQNMTEDDPQKEKLKPDENHHIFIGKSQYVLRKSQKKHDDLQKSEKNHDDDPQKSHGMHNNKNTVGYCNIGVSSTKGDKYYPSSKRYSLSRLESCRSGSSTTEPQDSYEILSSSSELIESNRKSTNEYLKKDLKTFCECSNKLSLSSKPIKKKKYFRPKGSSLIGWRKEQSSIERDMVNSPIVYDISEASLIQHSSESSDMELPLRNNTNRRKKRTQRNSSSSITSNDSEDERVPKGRTESFTNPSSSCLMCNATCETNRKNLQGTDSEGKSSVDEEMAKDLVQSVRSILSKMANSTMTVTEPTSKGKYNFKKNPQNATQGINRSFCSSNQDNSNSRQKSNSRISLKNIDIEGPFSHQTTVKNIVINDSDDNEETNREETEMDLKYSIEKNLSELASLLPTISKATSYQQQLSEQDCTCDRSLHTIKETLARDSRCCFPPSFDGSEVSKAFKKKESISKIESKSSENKSNVTLTRPKKSSNKTLKLDDALKKRLATISALSSVKAHSKSSSRQSSSNDQIETDASEEINSSVTENSLRSINNSKEKNDFNDKSKTKHSKSSPTVGSNGGNKTNKKLSKGKSMNTCLSTIYMIDEQNLDKDKRQSEEQMELGPNMEFMRNSENARWRIDIQNAENRSKRNIFEIDACDGPPEISLGSLDTNDLSSYTILDLGLPSETRFPKLSLFPSDMNASWLVLQRQGSKDFCKFIPEMDDKKDEFLKQDFDYGPTACESRLVLEEVEPEDYSEISRRGRKHGKHYDKYKSSDSQGSSEQIDCEKSKRLYKENTYIGHR